MQRKEEDALLLDLWQCDEQQLLSGRGRCIRGASRIRGTRRARPASEGEFDLFVLPGRIIVILLVAYVLLTIVPH